MIEQYQVKHDNSNLYQSKTLQSVGNDNQSSGISNEKFLSPMNHRNIDNEFEISTISK